LLGREDIAKVSKHVEETFDEGATKATFKLTVVIGQRGRISVGQQKRKRMTAGIVQNRW